MYYTLLQYGYDSFNRLMAVTNAVGTNALVTRYVYDGSGNLTNVALPNGVTNAYAYNGLNRLTTLTAHSAQPSTLASYTYDAVGNRLSRTSTLDGVSSVDDTFDANDWLDSDSYDAKGNTTTLGDGYDFENRLTSATRNGNTLTITYDGRLPTVAIKCDFALILAHWLRFVMCGVMSLNSLILLA